MNLKLTKPLAFFDLETTGTNTAKDKIVSLAILKINPDGTTEERYSLINPEMPIPPEATEVHKITDEMVTGEKIPKFRQIAKSLLVFLNGCDLGGFGITRFDIPMLIEEFARANVDLPLEGVKFVDALSIFHKKEERNLEAASRFYLKKEFSGAHNSLLDTKRSYEVFTAQLKKYEDLGEMESIDQIATFCKGDDNRIDFDGKFIKDKDGVYRINFGKHKGASVKEVFTKTDPGYYKWMKEKGEFTSNTMKVLDRLYTWATAKPKTDGGQ